MLIFRPFGSYISNSLRATAFLAVAVMACANTLVVKDTAESNPVRIEKGEPVWQSHPGSWGDLDIRSIYLEAPDRLVAGLKQPNSTTAWHFPGASEATITALFDRAGLSKETQAKLLVPQRILMHEGVMTLFADPEIMLAMTLEQRSVIYKELASSTLNPMHASPAYVLTDNPDDWLKDAHISTEQKQVVKQLLWKDRDVLAFSDLSILLALTKSDTEITTIFKFMTRVRSLIVTLKLSADADWKPLARYWTGEGRYKDCEPLLISAAERDNMRQIDITHLLPTVARTRLYTFPSIDSAAEGRLPDCQWTSLNFFNGTPRDYYLDARLTAARLHEAYDVVNGPYQYGDVLEFLNPQGDAVHACVYVADNIVFTKNGDSMIKPWILMWLSDLKKLYLRDGYRICDYRLKPLAP